MSDLDSKLEGVLKYISDYCGRNGYPPAVREIGKALNIPSTATVYYYLKELEESGYIRKPANRKRALEIIKGEYAASHEMVKIPLIGKITAGKPIDAIEDYEDTYPLPAGLFARGELFMLRVKGDSMIDAGIQDGDKIVLKRQSVADNGQIVAALMDGEATVKRFYKMQNNYRLHPENKRYEDIIVSDVDILGILVGLIRTY